MDGKDAFPVTPSLETPLPAKEEPLVELRWKKWAFYYGIMSIILVTWFAIFGAIIPYLTTGDFNEIWPAHKYRISEKVVLFVMSWICLPCLPFLACGFRIGVVSSYETYVEQRPYLPFFKTHTIPYDAMHLKERSNGMAFTKGSISPWQVNQFKYWKKRYWECIGFSKNSMLYSNPESMSQAIKLARERAVKIDRS
jgi:hypothetical protein